MKGKQIVLLGVILLFAGSIAYPVGRHVGAVNYVANKADSGSGSFSSRSVETNPRSEQIDLTKATIANIGSLGSEQVFDLISAADPQLRALWAKQLEKIPLGPKKRAAIRSFYKTLVQLDPAGAAQLIVDCKDPATRELAIRGAIVAAAPATMSEMARMLDRLGPEEREGYIYIAIWNWSLADPAGTAKYIEQHLSVTESNQAYILVHNWTAIDPESAKAWIERVPLNEGQRWQALKGLVGGLVERDRKTGLDYVVAHAAEPDFSVAVNTAAKESFLHSPDEARDLVLRLSDPEVQSAAINEITLLTNAEQLEEMRRSEGAIAKWLITLPPDLWREQIGQVEERWNTKDPDEFTGWLNQLPSEIRDVAVAGYCAAVSSYSLEDAIDLGRTITDPRLLDETLRNAITASEKTRAEILEVLDTLKIPSQQKAYLTRLIPDE